MPSASRLANSISCPRKFLDEYEGPQNRFSFTSTQQERTFENLNSIVSGRVFEASIQHLMTSPSEQRERISEDMEKWFLSLVLEATPRSLNEIDEPWEKSWIEGDDVRDQLLSIDEWYSLMIAFTDWKQADLPWKGEEVVWQREVDVEGKISLFEGMEEIDAWGRIDLLGRSSDKEYIVELKATRTTSIRKARAQASIYDKVLSAGDTATRAFVYHHTEQIIDPFEDEDWAELHQRGVDGDLNPTSYNCLRCNVRGCIGRFSDGRSFGY